MFEIPPGQGGAVHVWIVSSVRYEVPDHIVEGVWSDREVALDHLARMALVPDTIRCYMSHAVVDAPDEY